MDTEDLKNKLCKGVEGTQESNELQKVEKVLAPFLRTLKKKKLTNADIIAEESQELYLKHQPKDLILELETYFSDPIKIKTLMNETAELLKVATNSKGVNLYLTDYSRGEILLCPKYSKGNERFERRYTIETGTYVAAHVAFTKEYVFTSEILGDVRFPNGIPGVSPLAKSVIGIPIVTNLRDTCIGVIELYRDCPNRPYNLVNLQICTALTAWMGIAIELNSAKLLVQKEMKIQMHLSGLADMYFSGVLSFSKVISDLLKITKDAASAERGSFYIFRETVLLNSEEELLADAYEEGLDDSNDTILYKKRSEIRFAKNEPGIAGYVARTGNVINIIDAYKDYRFNPKIDSPSFRTRSVLAFPVKNNTGVLGVLKLCNCLDYPYFRYEEADLVQSYLNYVVLICEYYNLETNHSTLELRMTETKQLLDFHMKPSTDDIAALKMYMQGEQQIPSGFYRFEWDLSNYEEDAHKFITYAVFNSDVFEPFLDLENFFDFVLRVKKAYRPIPYHNFEHAFSVFHCAFIIIIKNKDVYTAIEAFTILLAALCHDLDHSGLTNSFLTLKNDTLYKLYGEYCGEAHSYEVCMHLIQTTDLLADVSNQNFQIISKGLKKLILSFDLAIHFQNRINITKLLNSDSFDWQIQEHRELSQNMILTCADWFSSFKSPETSKKFAFSFSKESYRQGDLEKSMGFLPLPIMDRNKSDLIAENQIIILTVVALPCVEIVVALFPNLSELLDHVNYILENWKELFAMRGQEMWKANQAMTKDKRDRRYHKLSLSGTLSSAQTLLSYKSK